MSSTDKYGGIKTRLISMASQDPGLPLTNPSIAFWQEPPHPLSNVQSEQLPDNIDYAIIGSGITGCSVASTLLSHESLANKRVSVFEARALTSGATGRNGGHLVSPAALEFGTIAAKYGRDKATEVAHFSYRNIDRMYELVGALDQSLQEESELRRVTTVVNFLDAATYESCQESLRLFKLECPELAARVSLLSAEDAKKKYDFAESEGAFEEPAGALWPYRLITGIFAKLLAEHHPRFSIETHTPVTNVAYTSARSYPYTLQTPRGPVHAGQVIYCVNGFTSHLIPQLRGKIFPLRGTMSTQTLSPAPPNHGASHSWSMIRSPTIDADTGIVSIGLYYMTQNAKTGDFFLGGEKQKHDEIFVSDDTTVPSLPADNLTRIMPTIFQSEHDGLRTTSVKRTWSGIMGYTSDMMPLVGSLGNGNGNDNAGSWIAAGFNGHGMDKCWLVGEVLGAMIAGEDVAGRLPSLYEITEQRLQAMEAAQFVEGFLNI